MIRNFLRTAAVSPQVFLADTDANVNNIIDIVKQLDTDGVDVAVFPDENIEKKKKKII